MNGRLVGWLNGVLAFIAAQYDKFIGIGGFTLYMYYSYFTDDLLWWFIVDKLGYISGNLVMSAVAFPHNLLWLLVFNWYGFDWLGIKLMDRLRKKLNRSNEASLWEGMSSWWTKLPLVFIIDLFKPWRLPIMIPAILLGKGDRTAFWVLSIFTDSFVTTVYLRHGNFESIKKKDLKIFFTSTLISVIYWSFRNAFVVFLAKAAWNFIFAI
jgi:hypothetical protein